MLVLKTQHALDGFQDHLFDCLGHSFPEEPVAL